MVRSAAFLMASAGAELRCGPGADYPAAPTRLANDRFRPRLHFSAPQGYMNDIIRPVFVKGRYHVFFEYNPCGSLWGNESWGHASSTDLVTWADEPVALWPDHDYESAGGIFTGSVIALDGGAAAFYTAAAKMPISWSIPYTLGSEVVALAVSHDLTNWKKDTKNPVLAEPPQNLLQDGEVCVTGFRDPSLLARRNTHGELQGYHMLLSGGLRKSLPGKEPACNGSQYLGGAAFHFESDGTSLESWSYKGVLLSHEATEMEGKNWECVSTVNFPEHNALLLAFGREPEHRMLYSLGSYDEQKQLFAAAPDPRFRALDFGTFYAAPLFEDQQQRRLVLGWIDELRSDEARLAAGWSGLMSFPRELSINDGKLVAQPYSALRAFRAQHRSLHVEGDRELVVDDAELIGENVYELHLEFDCSQSLQGPAAVIALLRSLDGGELTSLSLFCPTAETGARMVMDLGSSSKEACQDESFCPILEGEAEHQTEDRLEATIFVDASVIETFFAGSMLTARAYPSAAASFSIWQPSVAPIRHAEVWSLRQRTEAVVV